ncbi:MAG: choice-of-anchor I family protein, partial [Treponema sp.]|nr:choice-of-anchor I family protein [Treponema sp.]
LLAGCRFQAESSPAIKLSMNGRLSFIGRYSTGFISENGGVAEIVQYNRENRRLYLVNGALGSLDIVDASSLRSGEFIHMSLARRIDMKAMGLERGFEYGDLTSVAIGTVYHADAVNRNMVVALAVQHSEYTAPGYVVLVNYEGDYLQHFRVGIQPDMICFTKDGQYILTADEGEPRRGYDGIGIDPPGSVSILNVRTREVKIVDFVAFDREDKRTALVADGVILTKGVKPSVDFEPEYITVDDDGRTAWVSLQEANAIAVVNIPRGEVVAVHSLGFKDHSQPENAVDVLQDGRAILATQNLWGARMPDGLAAALIGGKQYILSANEGDAREWGGSALDASDYDIGNYEINVINTLKKDGLDPGKAYLMGARSFSIWEAAGSALTMIFDSGSDFERITAQRYPSNFNSSHINNVLDNRSGKKGPEPEYVSVLGIGDKTFAFIGLERIGGVMMYDISVPASPVFCDYINTRNFSAGRLIGMGDLGPEGICTVEAQDSPTGTPLVFVANEVSGTVAVFEVVW